MNILIYLNDFFSSSECFLCVSDPASLCLPSLPRPSITDTLFHVPSGSPAPLDYFASALFPPPLPSTPRLPIPHSPFTQYQHLPAYLSLSINLSPFSHASSLPRLAALLTQLSTNITIPHYGVTSRRLPSLPHALQRHPEPSRPSIRHARPPISRPALQRATCTFP